VFILISAYADFSSMKTDEEKFIKKFGETLRQIRLERNLSQEMLANDANIPINQIGRIERGEICTSILTIYKICKAIDLPITDLFL
jgi:transcriptional regulator with XRE-family HTH domain